MNKCIVTNKETRDKTKGVSLSREGRALLTDITTAHNEKIFQYYKDKNKEANDGVDLDDETLRNFAPTISKKNVLKLLIEKEVDIMDTRAEVLDEA